MAAAENLYPARPRGCGTVGETSAGGRQGDVGDALVLTILLRAWLPLCPSSRLACPGSRLGLRLGVIPSESLLSHLHSGNGHDIYLVDCCEVTAKNTWGTQSHRECTPATGDPHMVTQEGTKLSRWRGAGGVGPNDDTWQFSLSPYHRSPRLDLPA